jgi:diguanylate cyclase (GGDEF)-like protein
MTALPSVNFGQSERGLFSPEEIRRLMQVEHQRAQRYDYPLALFLIEIDRLGSLHDLYGVESKQRILSSVLALLRSGTRASDVLGCLRDERLLLLFPHTPREAAQRIARRLLRGCRALDFQSDGRALRASLSIGHVQRTPDAGFEELLEAAEEALRRAVQAGGDRCVEGERRPAPAAPPPPPLPAAALPPARARREGPVVLPRIEELRGATLEEKVHSLFLALGPGSNALGELEREVVAVVRRTVAESHASRSSRAEVAREIELLEGRVARLRQMLEATEEELGRLVQEKSADPGIASIYRSVQGIAPGERNYEKKKELLTVIYRANVELLRQLKELG